MSWLPREEWQDICYKVSSLIIEAIAFAHWEITKGISYLQKGKTNEKTEAVYMDSFLQKSAMREKRKWGGAVVIIQEGSMTGEGFILIL